MAIQECQSHNFFQSMYGPSIKIDGAVIMKNYLAKLSLALLSLTWLNTAPALASDKPVLTIYTYESFTTEWVQALPLKQRSKHNVIVI